MKIILVDNFGSLCSLQPKISANICKLVNCKFLVLFPMLVLKIKQDYCFDNKPQSIDIFCSLKCVFIPQMFSLPLGTCLGDIL